MTPETSGKFAHKMRHVARQLRDQMTLFGYEEVMLPIIEPAEIFLTRAGDTIIDRLFTFERGGKQRALRPEFTASAAYAYGQQDHQTPVRWQFDGVIFEDDPSSPTKQFQRYSIGAEYIGQGGTDAEAEIISMAVQGLERLGITEWQLTIGHVGLQMHLLAQHQLDRRVIRAILSQREVLRNGKEGLQQAISNLKAILPQLPEKATIDIGDGLETEHMLDILLTSTGYGRTLGGRTRQDIAQRMIDKRTRANSMADIQAALSQFQLWEQVNGKSVDAFAEIAKLVDETDETAAQLLADWGSLVELLGAYGITQDQVSIQADLTRHWEYYTGVVFGIWSDTGELLAAGGRYDDLAQLLGSEQPVPAVGFAYYADAVLNTLTTIPPYPKALVFVPNELSSEIAIQAAQTMRVEGIPVKLQEEAADADLQGTREGIYHSGKHYVANDIQALINDLKAEQI